MRLRAINSEPFVVYDSPAGAVTDVFPPTGSSFATRQVDWFRIGDGVIAELDAIRRAARRRERRGATVADLPASAPSTA